MRPPESVLTDRLELEEYFLQPPGINGDIAVAYNLDFEVKESAASAGTAASTDCVIFADGGITLGCQNGDDTDDCVLQPHLDTTQTAWAATNWGTDNEIEFETLITPRTSLAEAVIFAGLKLTSTPVIATDDDSILVRYEDDVNSGKLQTNISVGGTDTTVSTDFEVGLEVPIRVRITLDAAETARIYIDGVLVQSASFAGNSADLIPYAGIAADAGSSTAELGVLFVKMSRRYA